MIVLLNLVIVALSFTAVPTWLLVILMLGPAAAISLFSHEPATIEAAVLALLAALAMYAPLAWLASRLTKSPYAVAFRRFRPLLFLVAMLLFVVTIFSLSQLVLG